MIKVVVPRLQTTVLSRAMQVYGAMGLTPDTPLALLWTWGRALQFVDGPDEVHLRTIARHEMRRQEAHHNAGRGLPDPARGPAAGLTAMAWPEDPLPPIREEVHFGDRRVRCFADRPPSVPSIFAAALERNPEGDALVAGDLRLSYRQLAQLVRRTAAGLGALGVEAGDRVALLLGNRPEFLSQPARGPRSRRDRRAARHPRADAGAALHAGAERRQGPGARGGARGSPARAR